MVPFVLVVLEVPDIPKVSVGPVILAVPVVLMTLVVPVVQVTFMPAAVLSIGEVVLPVLVNRPDVAGAVLHTPPSFIH